MTRKDKHTCVGLGLELMRRWRCLESRFPGLIASTALMSCEESVPDVDVYVDCTDGPYDLLAPDKEHVMVGIHIDLGGRFGILIADPGYHVAKVVTVMLDGQPPNTGLFTQVDEPDQRKNFMYAFNQKNSSYVEWHEIVKRNDENEKSQISLIYADRPFCDGIRITEKRNIVYSFKSLVSRDQWGKSVAGLYFILNQSYQDANFTYFYHKDDKKFKGKIKFNDLDSLDEETINHIKICNSLMKFPNGKLFSMISQINKAVADESFVSQVLTMNQHICQLCI